MLQDVIEEYQSCKSNAPLHITQDTTSIEKIASITLTLPHISKLTCTSWLTKLHSRELLKLGSILQHSSDPLLTATLSPIARRHNKYAKK